MAMISALPLYVEDGKLFTTPLKEAHFCRPLLLMQLQSYCLDNRMDNIPLLLYPGAFPAERTR